MRTEGNSQTIQGKRLIHILLSMDNELQNTLFAIESEQSILDHNYAQCSGKWNNQRHFERQQEEMGVQEQYRMFNPNYGIYPPYTRTSGIPIYY